MVKYWEKYKKNQGTSRAYSAAAESTRGKTQYTRQLEEVYSSSSSFIYSNNDI